MFWKKNKKKGLPDLPIPKVTTSKTKENEETSSLPSFPDTPLKRGFSQSIIKDAVEPEEIPNFPPKNIGGKGKLIKEITREGTLPEIPERNEKEKLPFSQNNEELKEKSREINEWTPREFKTSSKKIIEKRPIFIKLDKFNEAKESLEEIKGKLEEITEMLKTLKEVKVKEETELSDWEKEMEELKARLGSLTADVFENIER